MIECAVLSIEAGKPVDPARLPLNESVFGVAFNQDLVHQLVTTYLSRGRSGCHAQKTRAEVRGGGKKPWRQKGTGRARAGSIRSPLWRGGGKTFAAEQGDYGKKLNKKMYRLGMRAILSELVRQERLLVVNSLAVSSHKTKDFLEKTKYLNLERALIVTDEWNENLYLACRNLTHFELKWVKNLDPVSLIKFEKILMTQESVRILEDWLQ